MKNHISMLTDLQATIEQKKTNGTWFDVSSRTDRMLLLKNSLHLADVSNPTKPTVSTRTHTRTRTTTVACISSFPAVVIPVTLIC